MRKRKKEGSFLRLTPRRIYQSLDSSNRIQFWTISGSIFICVFAILIGVLYQYYVVNNFERETEIANHIAVIDKMKNKKDVYFNHVSSIIDIFELLDTTKSDALDKRIPEIISITDSCINISEEAKYYVMDSVYRKIYLNNFKLQYVLNAYKSIKLIEDSTSFEDTTIISKDWNNVITQNISLIAYDKYGDALKNIVNNISDTIKLYVDSCHSRIQSLTVFEQSLKKAYEELDPLEDCSDFFSQDIPEIKDTVLLSLFSKNGIKYPFSNAQDFMKAMLLAQQRFRRIELNRLNIKIVSLLLEPLADNYFILNNEVKPISDNRVPLIPHNKNEVKKILKEITKVDFSPQLRFVVLSLFVISLSAIIIWFVILKLFFRNKEKQNVYSDNEDFLELEKQLSQFMDETKIAQFDSKDYHSRLSPINKISVWVIVTSCVASIFIFWLGLVYQFFVVDPRTSERMKLTHFQVVDCLVNLKREVIAAGGDVYSNSISLLSTKDSVEIINKAINIVNNEWENILSCTKRCILISDEAKYYFSEEKFNEITNNNFRAQYALEIIDLFKDESTFLLSIDSLLPSLHKYMLKENMFNDNWDNYTDSLNKAIHNARDGINKYSKNFKGFPKLGAIDGYIFYKHLLTLFMNDTIDIRKKKEAQSTIRPVLEGKKVDVFVSYFFPVIHNALRSIDEEIAPLQEDGLLSSNFFSNNQNDILPSYVSSDFHKIIILIIIITVLGFFFWWIIILFVFRKIGCSENKFQSKGLELNNSLALYKIIVETATSIKGIKANLDSQGTSIKGIKANLDSQGTSIKGIKANLDSQGTSIKGIKANLDSQGTSIKGIKANLDSQGTSIKGIKANLDSQGTSIKEIKANLGSQERDYVKLKKRVNAFDREKIQVSNKQNNKKGKK